MYSKKGGNTDPCDTPVILETLNAKQLIAINFFPSAKYDSNHLYANP